MNLAEFSVRHSVFGNMLTLFVLIGGLLMVIFLQRETFPDIDLDMVVVTTRYPNASPEEVENLVTNPLEDKIREVEDIEEFTSSSVEGISVIVVKIDPEARYKERAINEVQRKVDQVSDLPEEAEDPEVEAVQAQGPIIRVAVAGPVSEKTLRDYGDYLKDRFEQILGVSSVAKQGWRDQEFWVEVDLDRIAALEVALTDVARALAVQNVNRPGGKVDLGSRELVLRSIGEFDDEESIRRVVVRSNTDGNHVTVGDIATVTRTYEDDVVFTKVNGERAVVLGVKKKESGDTIDIADAVKALVTQEQARAPEGVRLSILDDESFYVKRRLNVLSSNGLAGMALVTATLLLFMNWRVALIVAIGIPFSFLAALMVMSFFGITINLITMFGLIIVLGMLVDDSIIVGENIYRHLEMGKDPQVAAVEGTAEVMAPVISTVLTTIAAFLPLVFAPDLIGQVLRWFPIVVSIALLSSLFEALFIMPCHVSDFVGKLRVQGEGRGARSHPVMGRMMSAYERAIRAVLKGRYLFLILTAVVFAGMVLFAVKKMRVDIFPADLIDIFLVRVTTPQGTTLERTETILGDVEQRLAHLPEDELQDIVSYVGAHLDLEGSYKAQGSSYASSVVYLTPQNSRARKTVTILDEMRERCRGIPDVDTIEFEMIEPGPPTGKPLEVRVRGPEYTNLLTIAGEIVTFLRGQEGVYDIQDDYEPGKDELHVSVDEAHAARLGLNMEAIAQTIWTAFQGLEATSIREGNDEVVIRVMLQEPYRDDLDTLENLMVPNQTGRLIPLGTVATFERRQGLPAVFHYDGDRVITVSAFFGENASSVAVNRALEQTFRDLPGRYPGYDLVRGGEWKETRKLLIFMYQAFGIAVLLIFVILAIEFDSLLQPIVVLAAIPLGLIGVVLALMLHHQPISMMAMMGMVGLAGVVVNDAIVLVAFINDKRRKLGMAMEEAIAQAGQKRLRPIFLTSVTTIVGLVPVIYGWGGYEPFVAPAAIVLAYGLLFATVLTLFVIPCIYYVSADLKRGAIWLVRHRPRRRRGEPQPRLDA